MSRQFKCNIYLQTTTSHTRKHILCSTVRWHFLLCYCSARANSAACETVAATLLSVVTVTEWRQNQVQAAVYVQSVFIANTAQCMWYKISIQRQLVPVVQVNNGNVNEQEPAISVTHCMVCCEHYMLYWSPRLATSHYCQQLTLSGCLSVTLLQIASSFCLLMESSHFWPSVLHVALQNVVLTFFIYAPNAQNLLPKICTESPITLLVWQIDPRCLGLPGGFRGWSIQWNHAKCCGADPCCYGNEIWARRRDQVAYYRLVLFIVQVCQLLFTLSPILHLTYTMLSIPSVNSGQFNAIEQLNTHKNINAQHRKAKQINPITPKHFITFMNWSMLTVLNMSGVTIKVVVST